jgi:predicted dehydrogenase
MRSDFEIVGLVSRGAESRHRLNRELGGSYIEFDDYFRALETTRPEAVCIGTYPETHATYAVAAMEAGAHVFLEKPIATTASECDRVVSVARRLGRKLLVGYILQVHPTWQQFVEIGRTLGKPLVMRMNLNQQSYGSEWETHKNLLQSVSPIVDCGVHYIDVMCRITGAQPVRVNSIGARLTTEVSPEQVNYGQLQVAFDDQSVGWYEAGWGPMMSETAFFIKDIIGPDGSVSMIHRSTSDSNQSSDVDSHVSTDALLIHRSEPGSDGGLAKSDTFIDVTNEPDHYELCRLEQERFLGAIHDEVDLTEHMESAVQSLRIALTADQSRKEGRSIDL